ncbi:BON domain-containing protein [Catenulispora sp. NF23]|uniref:BON domain-containing protein n=1 Tax=Catenulispora pinistramenti TaxID=2705254 RepID=A0ABS5KQG7_9ACTN|nr:BON domain-containing protein [Catenulispora pinistramenti]MBS2531725.1 BON domain-containing protein [Catenulispora pinistramenti]MBS2548292.1 BON domain-containing protein [Catenulispora pinistramenti]
MTQTQQKTDGALKVAIISELAWTAGVDSAHVGVAVTDGAVTLSGEVESYPEKLRAEKAVARVHGVTAIAAEITVHGRQTVNDTDIAREAGEALDRAVDVPAGSVTASVHDHAITLSGQVPWNYQREAAGRAVRDLRGVTDLHNTVGVRPEVSATNIKTSISAALVRTARAEARDTVVTADTAGVVTLAGTVHSMTERRAAEYAAWSAPGVADVVNHLRVQN